MKTVASGLRRDGADILISGVVTVVGGVASESRGWRSCAMVVDLLRTGHRSVDNQSAIGARRCDLGQRRE